VGSGPRSPGDSLPIAMRRAVALLAVSIVALGATGCNGKQDAYSEGATEGTYLAAGGLKYQVQVSRELNPSLIEDRAYLRRLPAHERKIASDQTWFGVWLRVENNSDRPLRSTPSFEITDTLGKSYSPEPSARGDELAYAPTTLSPGALQPNIDSIAGRTGPLEGAILLFKIDTSAYQNRPLEFRIISPTDPTRVEARVQLDV
jgi:hypothetical protein